VLQPRMCFREDNPNLQVFFVFSPAQFLVWHHMEIEEKRTREREEGCRNLATSNCLVSFEAVRIHEHNSNLQVFSFFLAPFFEHMLQPQIARSLLKKCLVDCVAVRYIVLQCVAMCCIVLQCVAMCYIVLTQGLQPQIATGWQRCIGCLLFICHFPQKSPTISGSFAERDLLLKAFYASLPLCIFVELFAKESWRARVPTVLQRVAVCCSVLQCVAACCSEVQCVAVHCSVLQRVAACCSVLC